MIKLRVQICNLYLNALNNFEVSQNVRVKVTNLAPLSCILTRARWEREKKLEKYRKIAFNKNHDNTTKNNSDNLTVTEFSTRTFLVSMNIALFVFRHS